MTPPPNRPPDTLSELSPNLVSGSDLSNLSSCLAESPYPSSRPSFQTLTSPPLAPLPLGRRLGPFGLWICATALVMGVGVHIGRLPRPRAQLGESVLINPQLYTQNTKGQDVYLGAQSATIGPLPCPGSALVSQGNSAPPLAAGTQKNNQSFPLPGLTRPEAPSGSPLSPAAGPATYFLVKPWARLPTGSSTNRHVSTSQGEIDAARSASRKTYSALWVTSHQGRYFHESQHGSRPHPGTQDPQRLLDLTHQVLVRGTTKDGQLYTLTTHQTRVNLKTRQISGRHPLTAWANTFWLRGEKGFTMDGRAIHVLGPTRILLHGNGTRETHPTQPASIRKKTARTSAIQAPDADKQAP